jgi:hypothetical protein
MQLDHQHCRLLCLNGRACRPAANSTLCSKTSARYRCNQCETSTIFTSCQAIHIYSLTCRMQAKQKRRLAAKKTSARSHVRRCQHRSPSVMCIDLHGQRQDGALRLLEMALRRLMQATVYSTFAHCALHSCACIRSPPAALKPNLCSCSGTLDAERTNSSLCIIVFFVTCCAPVQYPDWQITRNSLAHVHALPSFRWAIATLLRKAWWPDNSAHS